MNIFRSLSLFKHSSAPSLFVRRVQTNAVSSQAGAAPTGQHAAGNVGGTIDQNQTAIKDQGAASGKGKLDQDTIDYANSHSKEAQSFPKQKQGDSTSSDPLSFVENEKILKQQNNINDMMKKSS
eukprot:TRINITY_DN6048_c0_g1_i2.p1 TRINITY_DN6048_c0_g1~~TRINITY_DN6048_c0_g1_i2.p1  ORF type:complete len:124 (+),score=39.14 TRINITY_DN6048_c0_g1_i2:45-416(+)